MYDSLVIIQIWSLMQDHQKQNFLRICYETHKRLKLYWNFKAINLQEHYFRHTFVLASAKQDQHIKLLDYFIKKMKSGDLFCCVYPHNTYGYKMGRWIEKSQLNSFTPQRYLTNISKSILDKTLKLKMIERVAKQIRQLDQPVIVNFLGVQKHEVEFYKNQIMIYRTVLNPSLQYIVNLFGQFDHNSISVHSGFNLFQSNNKLDQLAEYYHKMVNSAVVQNAKIDIIALDGQISLFNEIYWKSTDFNRISATYYGPSSLFDSQTLYFFTHNYTLNIEHEFQIKLNIKLFQKKILKSTKKIKINFHQQKQYYPTFTDRGAYQFYHQKNIFLSQNPNRCEMIVKFKLNKEEHQQNI